MAMAGPGFLGVFLLLAAQMGLPLGLPPLPEDPTLARIAPEECLWYFSWSGVAEPDPKSKNQTEQLLAEPEVQQFVAAISKALGGAMQKGAPATRQGKVLGAEGPKLIHALLTHSTALFVSKVAIGPTGPDISGGLIVATGEQTDELKASLEKVENALLGAAASATGDAKFHKLPAQPGMPIVEWGFRGKYLLVGVGEGSAEGILSRMQGQTPAWLTAIKKRLPVERTSTVHYLNVKKIVDVAGPLLGDEGRAILTALGLNKVQQFASISGLEGTGYVSKSWVQVDGEPNGLLTVFGPEPLTAAELAPIPKNASFAVAARIHSGRLWSAILDGLHGVDPQTGAQFAAGIKPLEAVLGFRIKEDLLDTLGDSWCMYNSPGEGGLFITGLTIVVPLKNHDRLVTTNNHLVQMARLAAGAVQMTRPDPFGRRPTMEIKETTFQGQKIFSLNSNGMGTVFVPAWCVTDTHLILSLSSQNIRAFLGRDPAAGSLAQLPAVAEKLTADAPVMLTYQDTAGMLKITYPLLQMFATAGLSEMQREGLDLDASILPSLPSLLRHAEPGMSTLAREKDGLVYVSRRSLPVDLSLTSLIPIWSSWMFMSVRSLEPRAIGGPATIEAPVDASGDLAPSQTAEPENPAPEKPAPKEQPTKRPLDRSSRP